MLGPTQPPVAPLAAAQMGRGAGGGRGRALLKERNGKRKGQPMASLEFLPGTDGRLGPQRPQNHLWPAPSHQMPARCSPRKEGRVVVSTRPRVGCSSMSRIGGDTGVSLTSHPMQGLATSSLTDKRSPPPKAPHCISGQLKFF